MHTVIRKMTLEDVPEVAMLEQEIFTDPWSENVYRQTLMLDDTAYLVVCNESGEIVGAAGIRNIVGEGEITNVMVKPEHRNKGIAYEMLTKLLEAGRSIGANAFTLEVRRSNISAIKLYEKLGFVSEGIRPGFYEHPKEDALIMWIR